MSFVMSENNRANQQFWIVEQTGSIATLAVDYTAFYSLRLRRRRRRRRHRMLCSANCNASCFQLSRCIISIRAQLAVQPCTAQAAAAVAAAAADGDAIARRRSDAAWYDYRR